MSAKTPQFERSAELKKVFNELSDRWCKKHRLDLADLAERCGVSLQYLSHIGRYGRIPSKPILLLLALNLEAQHPEELFRIARITDPWPFERGIGLRPPAPTEDGLLSVNLDMRGFTSVIRDIVRAEIQPKRLEDLLGGRPLRVGLNYAQFFMFDGNQKRKAEGFFPELMRSIGLAVTAPVDFIDVLHTDFQDKLEQGVIDCYGPIYKTASRLSKSLFTIPFCTVPAAALLRVKKAPPLVELPPLRSFSDLQIRPYIVTVHRDSMAHHFAESVLGIHPNRILACELPEESLERIILNKIPRAAHLMLTDLPFAKEASKAHQKDITMFKQSEAEQEASFENCIAVRSDWQPLLGGINQALEYLKRNGAIGRLAERNPSENRDCIDWIP